MMFKPGENPIGHRFGMRSSPGDFEIVGVVEDTAYTDVRWKDHLMAFMPMRQHPTSAGKIEDDDMMYAGAIVVKTNHSMPDMESLVRTTLSSINPNLSVVKFQTFDEQIADRFAEDRMLARLTTLFGALALLLATIGLYGVSAYTVARRKSEIGIRMVLGAERLRVTLTMMRGAVIQALLGLAIGIPIAFLCVRFVQAELFEVQGIDARVLVLSVLGLAFAASAAGLIPARRAASIDPARTLRME